LSQEMRIHGKGNCNYVSLSISCNECLSLSSKILTLALMRIKLSYVKKKKSGFDKNIIVMCKEIKNKTMIKILKKSLADGWMEVKAAL
jgi:hypothetical protein